MYSKTIKKLVKKYTVHLIIIFFLANTSIALLIFSKAASNQCMTQTEIDSDSRCLYVYQNYVYEKGTRSKPHKGHACGMNVDSIMPNLHFVGSVLTKFNNTKIAPFCTGTNPTTTPTATATATTTATQQPTEQPTQTPIQSGQNPTQQPTANPTQTPTQSGQAATPTATTTSTPTQSGQTPTPTQTSVSYSGNTFGEILGKPKVEKVTPSPIATETESKLDLTKISKPITYISLLGFIGSIILVILF
ncbi:MAG: hypothetical protein AAB778_01820 [Patescibacteria group bacterium]